MDTVRVRFAPSPTGYLHIGGARTVLFNWLLSRKLGGRFILRIEDTDRARHVADSVGKIVDDLRWLGLPWDEGPEVGGDYGPYFQSQRMGIYDRYIQQLLEAGLAYYAFETPDDLAAMRTLAKAEGRTVAYIRPDPLPTVEEGLAARAAGRAAVVRLKVPAADITVEDDILGAVTVASGQVEDFVIQKSDGWPTYHFACVVDDERMKITHVLRGQEHLMNTPKHMALQRALGFSTPRYAHLPVIFNLDGSKMSKRDKEKAISKGQPPPEIDVHDFRVAGYLPEAVLNFIALLGWSPGEDREFFDLNEMTEAFSIVRVGKTNARFDREKLLSFNTTWATRVTPDRLLAAFKGFLAANAQRGADQSSRGLPNGSDPSNAPDPRRDRPRPTSQSNGQGEGATPAPEAGAAPLPCPGGDTGGFVASRMLAQPDDALREVLRVCAGFRTFADVIKKAGFLFLPDDAIEYDPAAVKKVLAKNDGAGFRMLEDLLPRLEALPDWSAASIDALLAAVCEEKQAKMGAVAQPLRVAVSGTTISPAIGETLALLGRERTLARLRRGLQTCSDT